MVRERGEDGTSVVDLLDASMVRNMKISKGRGSGGGRNSSSNGNGSGFDFGDGDSDFDFDSDDDSDDDGPELGFKDGKFVIPGDEDSDSENSDGGGGRGRGGGSKKKKRSRAIGDDSDDDNDDNEKSRVVDTGKDTGGFAHVAGRRARAKEAAAGGNVLPGAQGRSIPGSGVAGAGAGRGAGGKRQKTGGGVAVRGTASGAEFRSKKAGGDVKRKGAKLEPYAYIPLDGRTLTGKRSGGEALKQYEAVVGAGTGRAKKGYQQRRGGQQK